MSLRDSPFGYLPTGTQRARASVEFSLQRVDDATITTASLATIVLTSGRDVELTQLEVFSTYSGMLEGYPSARMNDRLLTRLATRPSSEYWTAPVHVISPPRRRLEPTLQHEPFGPTEMLPAVYCRAHFRSHPVDELDPVLNRSYLTVVWFQDELVAPVPEFVTAAVADLSWQELAEDTEL